MKEPKPHSMHAIRHADQSVSITTIYDPNTTIVEEVAKWHPVAQATVVDAHPITDDDLPKTREYRSAWTHDGKKFSHHMPRARDIFRNRVREWRKGRLEALDVEMSRAFNNPTKQAAIETQRQRLRDLTSHPKIEAAQSIEDFPTELLQET